MCEHRLKIMAVLSALVMAFCLPSYCLAYNWLYSNGHPVRWEGLSAEMQVDVDDFPVGTDEYNLAIEAMNAWTSVRGALFFLFHLEGTVNQDDHEDRVSSIGWENGTYFDAHGCPASAIGLTIATFWESSGHIVDADIALRLPRDNWHFGDHADCEEVRPSFLNTVIHELGHALGMEHEDDVPCIMNTRYTNADLGQRHDFMPNADDQHGFRSVYTGFAWGVVDLAVGHHLAPGNSNSVAPLITPAGPIRTGETFEMPYAIHNLSPYTVQDVRIDFYLSYDQNITRVDIPIGSTTIDCAAGFTQTGSITLSVPGPTIPWNYFLGYIIDPENLIAEADEENNASNFCDPIRVAQGSKVYVEIGTNFSGLAFSVDGINYTQNQSFIWDRGEYHTIGTVSPQNFGSGTQCVFREWAGSNNNAIFQTIRAFYNGGYVAQFEKEYYLTMEADGQGNILPGSGWYPANSEIQISAESSDDYCFGAWIGTGNGSYTGEDNIANIVFHEPINQVAQFLYAPGSRKVTIQTDPPGMPIYVDGKTYRSPRAFCWGQDEIHQIGVDFDDYGNQDAADADSRYSFIGWSNGGGQHHLFQVPSTDTTLTATFGRQFWVEAGSDGNGSVDLLSAWVDSGSTVNFVAEPNCGCVFKKWTGSGIGAYSGNQNPIAVVVEAPISEKAEFAVSSSPGHNLTQAASINGGSEVGWSWVDFDNDGDLDPYGTVEVLNGNYGTNTYRLEVYRNNGSSFTQAATINGGSEVGWSWVDFDNDGDLDPYGTVEVLNGNYGTKIYRLMVYRNDGSNFTQAATINGGSEVGWSWVDFDNDGDLDPYGTVEVLNGNYGTGTYRLMVYQNDGLNFTQAATINGGSEVGWSWVDFDNDGDLDPYGTVEILNGNYGTDTYRLMVYRNDGSNFTQAATINGGSEVGWSWIDFDNDGDLDPYGTVEVLNGNYGTDTYCLVVYRNDGSGFSQATTINGGSEVGWSWVDFDNDGDLDPYGTVEVLNGNYGTDTYCLAVYRNDGSGFSHAATINGGSEVGWSWVDFDNDGDLDPYGTVEVLNGNYGTDTYCLAVYRNDGSGFTHAATINGGSEVGWSWIDFDNDGDLDPYGTVEVPNANYGTDAYRLEVYRNNGSSFTQAATINGGSEVGWSWIDFDNDGDLDPYGTVEVLNGNYGMNTYRLTVYQNEPDCANHWLKLRLINGILQPWQSPKVTIYAGGRVHQQIANEAVLHFGLGSAQYYDYIIVDWALGKTQYIAGGLADRLVTVFEDQEPDIGSNLIVDNDTIPGENNKVLIAVDDSITLSFSILDTSGCTFHWKLNGNILYDGNHISGSHTLALSINGAQKFHSGEYILLMTNSAGYTESPAVYLSVYISTDADDDKNDEELPVDYSLFQNYPNPFNPTTNIMYTLPKASRVTIEILNILGQRVITLYDDYQEPGNHSIQWHGLINTGQSAASGIYFYRITAGEFVQTKKMLLLK